MWATHTKWEWVKMTALIDRYDLTLFDLDGVVYRGPEAVPGVVPALAELRRRGLPLGFVTNAAGHAPSSVAERLTGLGIPTTAADVITSAQVGATLLRERHGEGARIMVVGGAGVESAVVAAGMLPVASIDDDPVGLLQGGGASPIWERITEAVLAIHQGIDWVATNDDRAVPTQRGLVPANGAAVAAITYSTGQPPVVAGKPHPPLFKAALARHSASAPIFVGDRLDTDIAGARGVGLDCMLSLSGSHGPRDLLAAVPAQRPTHIGDNLAALLEPMLEVRSTAEAVIVGDARATVRDGVLEVHGGSRLESVWAAAHMMWQETDAGRTADASEFLARVA